MNWWLMVAVHPAHHHQKFDGELPALGLCTSSCSDGEQAEVLKAEIFLIYSTSLTNNYIGTLRELLVFLPTPSDPYIMLISGGEPC